MRDPDWTPEQAKEKFDKYVQKNLASCKLGDLARALHAIQDSYSPAHKGFQEWLGVEWTPAKDLVSHLLKDMPSPWNSRARLEASNSTIATIRQWRESFYCAK